MTGECRLDGNAAGLQVSNFSQHDDVGVLTKERLQGRGEGHSDLGSHQHLIDAEEVVFDRVLRRHDVDVDVVDLGQRRIKSRRLTGTRRSGNQHHAVRIGDRFHQLALGAGLNAERSEVEGQVALV